VQLILARLECASLHDLAKTNYRGARLTGQPQMTLTCLLRSIYFIDASENVPLESWQICSMTESEPESAIKRLAPWKAALLRARQPLGIGAGIGTVLGGSQAV